MTVIIKIANPGDLLGLYTAISGEKLEVTAEAFEPTQLAFVTHAGLPAVYPHARREVSARGTAHGPRLPFGLRGHPLDRA